MQPQLEKKYLSLKELEFGYGLNPSTIKKERCQQKIVQNNKTHYTNNEGKKVKYKYNQDDSGGFGFEVPAVKMYGRLMYAKADVEAWIAKQKSNAPVDDIAELDDA
tara:strand:- start:404 stop:721 length:318 start_codon:yes stop_codon:yes gene_type:complete